MIVKKTAHYRGLQIPLFEQIALRRSVAGSTPHRLSETLHPHAFYTYLPTVLKE